MFGPDTAANFVTGRRAGRISFSLTSTLAQVGLEVLLLYSSDFVPQMKKMLPLTSNLFYTRVFFRLSEGVAGDHTSQVARKSRAMCKAAHHFFSRQLVRTSDGFFS